MIRHLLNLISPEHREREEKAKAAAVVRAQFDAAFGHFDGPIAEGRRCHGPIGKALEAKQAAVHAALAGKAA